jgi:hypothetical protein
VMCHVVTGGTAPKAFASSVVEFIVVSALPPVSLDSSFILE